MTDRKSGGPSPARLEEELRARFGHAGFRPGQEPVIRSLMDGRPALAILPTGGGKSICYQLPAVLLPGLTLVVSPLIALMKDQVDALVKSGIGAARIDSTVGLEESREIFDGMKSGRIKLLYVAPERLANESFVARLSRIKLSLMAIDEAHCISEWGHNFRPEYLRLAKIAGRLGIRRVLALTATATPGVRADIQRAFGIEAGDVIQTSFHRPNLALHVSPVTAAGRAARLIDLLQARRGGAAIVYVTLQRTAGEVAALLQKAGHRARAYHAGMADDTRAAAQEGFMDGSVETIVATIAFGMGIDKADIRTVIHYNLPKTLENYQQEIGRAGRDGGPAHCEMLACRDDLAVLRNFVHGDVPDEAGLRIVVDHLLRQGGEFDTSLYELSRATDVRPLVLETVITYLEQENILEPLGAIRTTFQVGFNHPEARVVAGYSGERQIFLRRLFASGRRGPKWLTIDTAASAAAIGQPRERIQKALDHLADAGDIVLKTSGVRHRFRLREGATSRRPPEIARWLAGIFSERESRDLARIDGVLELAEHPGCTTEKLLTYFGETMTAPCGHCGNCRQARRGSAKLPSSAPGELSLDDRGVIRELKAARLPALQSPRQLARFLCGISSPAASRDRLGGHPAFGRLADIPFDQVLEACSG